MKKNLIYLATCLIVTIAITIAIFPIAIASAKGSGKVTNLTLEYNGSSTSVIKVVQKNGDTVFEGLVAPGGQFSFFGTDKGTLGTEITLYVDDIENTKIHTSCSQPIDPGLVFGDFTIISGESEGGEGLCPEDTKGEAYVKGVITDFNGTQIKGADVDVTCHHGGVDNSKSTKSKSKGKYKVSFKDDKCNIGDTVYVTATKDGMSGSNSGVVEQDSEGHKKKVINVAIVNVAIPEFGLLTGALTLLSSIGTFFIIKRR